MNTNVIIALLAGLLLGWLIEWVIDWLYWRRRLAGEQQAKARLNKENETIKHEKARLWDELANARSQVGACRHEKEQLIQEINELKGIGAPAIRAIPLPENDNLLIIKGIGPIINQALNEAGITTFAALGALTADDFRRVLANIAHNLVDEENILAQARALSEKKEEMEEE